MKLSFKDFSIRKKLILMMVFTSGLAIFVATAGLMFEERQAQFEHKQMDVQMSARMIAYNIGAALVFHDDNSAHELLQALQTDPDILAANLFDQEGKLFSSYRKEQTSSQPATAVADDDTFEVIQPITLGDEAIGHLQIVAGKEGVQLAITKHASIIFSIAFISLLFSVVVALWVQRFISRPVTRIANKMQRVTAGEDYSLRVDWHSNDELGELAKNFNAMLAQVEIRDVQLARQHEVLELKVQERTEQIRDGIEKLQRAEHSLNQIMQAMSQTGEAVLILNPQGDVEYLNDSCMALSGHSEQELRQTPGLLFNRKKLDEVWSKVVLGDNWKQEVTCSKKDGSKYFCLMSLSPITDDFGRVEQVVVILRDLSDREALEDQLRQSQKMESVGVLVGGIAHDFNNLLAGIVGNLELAKIDADNPEVAKVWLDQIEAISFRASETIAKLLAFARKNTVQMEITQLSVFLGDLNHLAKLGVSKAVELNIDCGDDDIWVNADTHQLQQVILNLLNNAAYAVEMHEMNTQPRVELSITKEVPNQLLRKRFPSLRKEEYAVIRVSDNGMGISQEHINRIFEPFFTTKPEGEGTGLGLSMAYGMTQRHGGAMDVESRHGKGTDFFMYLPMVEAHENHQLKAKESASEAIKGNGELVLLADDEELIRDFAANALKRLGYNVLVAQDGVEAMSLFQKNHREIDMVVLDLVMPQQGGIATAQQIQQLAPELPIMFVSGYDLNSSMDSMENFKDYTVLQKPYRLYDFASALQTHLVRGEGVR